MAKRKFDLGDFQLEVKRSRTGLGLFTLGPIAKGSCVVEYTGRLISESEVYASRSKYLFEVSAKKTIDGRGKGNLARYVNHSCRPNCEAEIWRGRVFVMARRAIKAGEELAYNYGADYFTRYIQPKGCRCLKCSPEGA